MFVRLSLCLIASTGVGSLGLLRATSAPVVIEVEQVWVANDRRIVIEQLYRLRESGLELQRVAHLDVAPAAEACVVVDRRAPGVSGRGGLRLSRAWALLASGDLHDQRAVEGFSLRHLETDQEVRDVEVGPALVNVRDREAEVI